MKQGIKRGLSILLTGATVLSLAACAGGGGSMTQAEIEAKRAAKLTKLSNVYTMNYVKSEGQNGVGQVRRAGDKTYVTTYYWNEIKGAEGEDSTYDSGNNLFLLNEEAGTLDLVRKFPSENSTDEAASTSFNRGVNVILPMEDGSLWYSETTSSSDWSDPDNYVWESSTAMVHEAADGTELCRFDVDELFDEEYTYVDNAAADASGNLVLFSGSGVTVTVDSNGGLIGKSTFNDDEETNIYQSAVNDKGEILALLVNYTDETPSRKIMKLDAGTGTMEELFDCSAVPDMYQFYPGEGDILYYPKSSGIHELNVATGEDREVLNYINSDINSQRINLVGFMGNKRFICTEYDKDYNNQRLAILEPASEEDTVEKYVLDFAAVWLNSNLQDAIIDFNKQSKDYRIQFVDYSVYNTQDDYEAGITKLNNDIISGNIPDMFSLDGLPLDNYVSKNLIADLKQFMDKDEEFHAEDYLENILNATEQDGKIYSLITSYYINCLISSKDYFNGKESITVTDLLNLKKQYPEAKLLTPYYTRNDVLTGYGGGNAVVSAFLKANDGNGAFNSEEFAAWLELAKEFPEEVNWEDYEAFVGENYDENAMYRDGRVLFALTSVGDFRNGQYVKRTYGEEYCYLGYPVPEGSGSGVVITPNTEIAISEKSVMQEEAWSFVKYLLGEDYQTQDYTLSVRKDVMEKKMADALKENDGNGFEREATAEIAVEDVIIGGNDGADYNESLLKVTQADIDKLKALIEKADTVVRTNTEVNKIIEEEAGAYFAGKKSAQDVCSIIQSRVQTYVSEDR